MHVFETEPKTRRKRDISKVCTCVCVCVCVCHVKTETLIDIVYRRDKWGGSTACVFWHQVAYIFLIYLILFCYRRGYSSIYNYNLYSNIIFVVKVTYKCGTDVISKTSVKRC